MKRVQISRRVLMALTIAGWLLAGVAIACGGGQPTEGRNAGTATPVVRIVTPTPSATVTTTAVPGPGQASPTATPRVDNMTPSPSPSGPGSTSANVPQNLLDDARRDLSSRTGVAETTIRLEQAEQVTWPDASLGHPEPGRLYAQVLTPGWRLVLAANNQRYAYHTDSQRVVFVGQAS